jgi:hypothetical protein
VTVQTTELDSSVARLLILADQIERNELPPPPVVTARPDSSPQPVVEPDIAWAFTVAAENTVPAVGDTVPAIDETAPAVEDTTFDTTTFDTSEAEPIELDVPVEATSPADEPVAVERPAVAATVAPIAFVRAEPLAPMEPRPLADVADYGRLEQVRVILSQLGSRHLGPRGKRRLEEARREERAILDRLGFDSYLDLMLTNAGTPQSASVPSRLENGERDGNGGADGGGASADIGAGGASPVPGPSDPWSPPVETEDRSVIEPELGVAWESGAVHVDVDVAVEGDDAPVAPAAPAVPPRPPTIADWLASATAPPIAAATVVDVGA